MSEIFILFVCSGVDQKWSRFVDWHLCDFRDEFHPGQFYSLPHRRAGLEIETSAVCEWSKPLRLLDIYCRLGLH